MPDGDGYLVSSHGAMVLAVFCSPAAAIRWALATQRECLDAEWPEELLEHELGGGYWGGGGLRRGCWGAVCM